MTDLYQIYYKPEHLSQLYPFAKPVENKGLTIFFENQVISEIVPLSESEKVAVCSWKLGTKMRRSFPITLESLYKPFEVLSFTRNSHRHQMLAMASAWHPDFRPAFDLLWSKLGMKVKYETRQPVYQNHYAAKTEIYKRYVSEFLKPSMELITKDEELNALMMKPSNYGRLSRDADLKSVKEKLGMTDYPLCPFVLERCPSMWFDLNGIKVSYL
jgi:hypothetical protein